MHFQRACVEPEGVETELVDGGIEGPGLGGVVGFPLVHEGETPEPIGVAGDGVGDVVVQAAVEVPALDDGAVDARVVHLRDDVLRCGLKVAHGGREVLLEVVDAVGCPDELAVSPAAKVDVVHGVQRHVLAVEERLMGDRDVVGDAAHGLVVNHDGVLDVAHVLADGRVPGGAAHGREDVGVGVDDHGRSLYEVWGCSQYWHEVYT